MTERRSAPPIIAILHLDESCLGNGREGENPGGGGGLIEARSGNRKIQRRDFYISSPATTNNRMALSGAIAALQLLARKGASLQVLIVSDSQYLVKGMREWVPGWIGRGWRRKEGPIENLELWQVLVKSVGFTRTCTGPGCAATRIIPRTSTRIGWRLPRRKRRRRPTASSNRVRRVVRGAAGEGKIRELRSGCRIRRAGEARRGWRRSSRWRSEAPRMPTPSLTPWEATSNLPHQPHTLARHW